MFSFKCPRHNSAGIYCYQSNHANASKNFLYLSCYVGTTSVAKPFSLEPLRLEVAPTPRPHRRLRNQCFRKHNCVALSSDLKQTRQIGRSRARKDQSFQETGVSHKRPGEIKKNG